MENRLSTDESELNKANVKTTNAAMQKPQSSSNSTRYSPSKGQNNKVTSMNSIKKTSEKHHNSSNHAHTSSFTNKTNAVKVTNMGGNKVLLNGTHITPNNKTMTMSSKIKTQFNNSSKTSLVNKFSNKTMIQTTLNGPKKPVNAISLNKQASTPNSLNKQSEKTAIPLKVNQTIAKPNVNQLLKNKPIKLLANNTVKLNNSANLNSTKQFVKLPTKTVTPSKPLLKTNTTTKIDTKYEKISSSNDVSKVKNSTTKTQVLNGTKIDEKVGDTLVNKLSEGKKEDKISLNHKETSTEKKETNESVLTTQNTTKTTNQTEIVELHENSDNPNVTTTESNESTTTIEESTIDTSTISVDKSSSKIDNDVINNNNTSELYQHPTGNETIVERTKVGDVDAEDGNGTSNVTAGSTVRASISNKSVDLDYDYDSLPPSLPNLK